MASQPDARFGFIGVTASQSSINRVFPRWAELLELGDVEFVPVDLPLDTSPDAYRAAVADIAGDHLHRGALVTSHKVKLLDAARDQFDELDRYAELCREISSISKRDGRLVGHAKDPITSGASMEEFLSPTHFRDTGGHVLSLGAGGSGLAIAVYLLERRPDGDRPPRIVLVNRSPHRLEVCREILESIPDVGVEIDYVQNADPRVNDDLMTALPPGSMVINATGLGKDRPGSPITGDGRLPDCGVAWELNYRGELDFLHQARAQADERNLRVEDGWRYFIHGWSAVVAEAFRLELGPALHHRLAAAASGAANGAANDR
jgi:shikimate dehydrogenase